MKISRLLFECVKDSINIPNTNFNEYSFLNGDFNNSKDYVNQISGALSAINLALSRLQDSNKIPYSTKVVNPTAKVINFEDGDIINIVQVYSDTYKRIPFRTMTNGKDYMLLCNDLPNSLLIEYRATIPHFTEEHIMGITIDEESNTVIDKNLDLRYYGVSDIMCDYVKEFVKGQLNEFIAPDLANLHNNRAEQYFQNLKSYTTSFTQTNVSNKHRRLF